MCTYTVHTDAYQECMAGLDYSMGTRLQLHTHMHTQTDTHKLECQPSSQSENMVNVIKQRICIEIEKTNKTNES